MGNAQTNAPRYVPEWRVHEGNHMIKKMPEPTGGYGYAGQFSVNRVQEGHHPPGQQSPTEPAAGEQYGRENNQYEAYERDLVRAQPQPSPHSRAPLSGPRPHPFGHQVGHPLVGPGKEALLA